jgi:DNA-binding Lrp family transcriptional regulator
MNPNAVYRIIYNELLFNGCLITRKEIADRLGMTIPAVRRSIAKLWDDGRLYRFTVIPTDPPIRLRPSKAVLKQIEAFDAQRSKC